jgi:ribosomal protein S18 acetylase RimI-like enzyme
MKEADILGAAEVHRRAFPRQTFSEEWVRCNLAAFPMTFCYVAEAKGKIIGLVIYVQKSGFRQEAIVEIEQCCVDPDFQGNNIGKSFAKETIPMVASEIAKRGAKLKTILANTRENNYPVISILENLGAKAIASISEMFTAAEVYYVIRDVDKILAKQE